MLLFSLGGAFATQSFMINKYGINFTVIQKQIQDLSHSKLSLSDRCFVEVTEYEKALEQLLYKCVQQKMEHKWNQK